MKIKILKAVLYIAGILCIVYPIYSRYEAYRNQTIAIYEYKSEIEEISEDEIKDKLDKSKDFNESNSTETTVIDSSTVDSGNDSISTYSFLEVGEMIGYINIPKISLELPIYEGVTQNNLQKGVAHMENTSLPNGDLSTHAVLAGHTGLSSAELFDNIDQLEIGDTFYITYLNQESTYEVINISIVLPDETSELKVEEGKCLVTLVTCTPKTVNTHRLLVTAQKIENTVVDESDDTISDSFEEDVASDDTINEFEILISFIKKNYKIFLFILIFIIVLFVGVIIRKIKVKVNVKRQNETKDKE